METWAAICSRRNVRAFTEEPIAPHDLDRILEAGWRSPSSNNEQRWDLVVCTDRRQLEQLSKAWTWAEHLAKAAAAIVLLAPAAEGEFVEFDLGQLTISMLLAATDLGIGTCHSAVGDQDLVRTVLGHPEDQVAVAMISLGFPADHPLRPIARPNRRPFDEVVHRGHWGNKAP
jgi:nitroreductase